MLGTVPGKGGSDDLLDEQTTLSSPGPATDRALGLLPAHKYEDGRPIPIHQAIKLEREALRSRLREG